MADVKFSFLFCIAVKTDSKLTLHQMGIFFYYYYSTDRDWSVTFLKTYITSVYWLSGILARARLRRQFYLYESVIDLFAESEPPHDKTKKMA